LSVAFACFASLVSSVSTTFRANVLFIIDIIYFHYCIFKMVMYCCVPSCSFSSKDGTFHNFPSSEEDHEVSIIKLILLIIFNTGVFLIQAVSEMARSRAESEIISASQTTSCEILQDLPSSLQQCAEDPCAK
jgi:hypothetical protein